MADDQKAKVRLEIAHVLFIDVVGYSKLTTEEQSEVLPELNRIVLAARAGMKLFGHVDVDPPVLVELSREGVEHESRQVAVQPQLANQVLTSSRSWVMPGSATPKSEKICLNLGITNTMIMETLPTAIRMTTAG